MEDTAASSDCLKKKKYIQNKIITEMRLKYLASKQPCVVLRVEWESGALISAPSSSTTKAQLIWQMNPLSSTLTSLVQNNNNNNLNVRFRTEIQQLSSRGWWGDYTRWACVVNQALSCVNDNEGNIMCFFGITHLMFKTQGTKGGSWFMFMWIFAWSKRGFD